MAAGRIVMIGKMKKACFIFAVVLCFASFGKSVKAEPVTSVVMTYEDKVFTKQIYGIETDRIKAGEDTDGLKDIGGLLDNLTFQTNGEVKVDKNAVISAVRSAIVSGQTYISLDLKNYKEVAAAAAASVAAPVQQAAGAVTASPGVTADMSALGIDYKLSESSTKFRANEDRAQNIRTAASHINGMVIMPGQMFSATTAFGPRTTENGYGLGNVISGDTYVKGVGGGICQVSSTLNLAVLRAGLVPVERHNHSHR